MLQNFESITRGRFNTLARPIRRRSLLREPLRERPRSTPLWRLVLAAYGVAATLYLLWILLHIITGMLPGTVSLKAVVMSLWPIALFVVPITLIGYFSSRVLDRHAEKLSPTGLRMARMVLWLGSGVLGSLIGYEILNLLFHGALRITPSVIAITLTANLLIVLVVSTVGAVVSARRRGKIMYRQEKLLTDEFEAAHRMQQSLLPASAAHIHGFDISSAMLPAVEVGGDYYDYLSFADGSKGILVADASGKGIPAALVMAKFQGMAQALSIHVPNPEEFFVGLNDTLRARLERQNFITVGMVTIDFENRCAFWRAGHNPLLHFRAATGDVTERKPPGIGLGLTHGGALGSALQPERFTMEAGDVLVLCSDGLTEAAGNTGEEFGQERLARELQATASSGKNAQEIRVALLDALRSFVGQTEEQHDDVTIVVIRRV